MTSQIEQNISRYKLEKVSNMFRMANALWFCQWNLILYILQIMMPGVIKISILLLYLWLFSAKRTLKLVLNRLIAFVAAYVRAFEISLAFSCKLIKSHFRPEVRLKCHNIKHHVLVQACVNVLLDLLVLLVPIPTVLRLQLGMRRRMAIVVIFVVASMWENALCLHNM